MVASGGVSPLLCPLGAARSDAARSNLKENYHAGQYDGLSLMYQKYSVYQLVFFPCLIFRYHESKL